MQRRAVRALEPHWQPAREDPETERLSFYLFGSWDDGVILNMHQFAPASFERVRVACRTGDEPAERAVRAAVTLGWLGKPRAQEPLQVLVGDSRIISRHGDIHRAAQRLQAYGY